MSAEYKEIAAIFPVHENLVGFACGEGLNELTNTALMAMEKFGVVDESTLEWRIVRPAEIGGVRLPIVLEDGTEIPHGFVLFRYSALAIPHEEAA